jgi:apolipoprotein N-acyltransferase
MDQVRGRLQLENQWRKWLEWRCPPGVGVLGAALALLATMPPVNVWPLGWVAFAPLSAILSRSDQSVSRAAGLGWLFGAVYWAGQYSWLGYTFSSQGGVAPWATAVFFGVFDALLAILPAVAFGGVAAARYAGLRPALTLPLAFGAMDWALGRFPFGGMGWGSLAAPQAETWAAGWIAPVLGGPGLVAGMAGMGTAWWALWTSLRIQRSPWIWAAAGALFAFTAAAIVPMRGPDLAGLEPASAADRGVSQDQVWLVPGQMPLREMLRGEGTSASLRYFLARTLAAISSRGADGQADGQPGGDTRPNAPLDGYPSSHVLIVWPEAAVMEPLNQGQGLVDLSQVGTLLDADFLVGSDANEPGRVANSLYLVTGGRFDFSRYDKRHLVPFGEFVPAAFRWAFGRKVTEGDQDYTPGTLPPVAEWSPAPGRRHILGLAICFESLLAPHAVDTVNAGAEVIVAAANDAWLPAYAVAQHIELSALRGREVGRDILFVSNGGPAALLRDGQIVARSDTLPLRIALAPRSWKTPWVRFGEGGLVAAFIVALAGGWIWGRWNDKAMRR